jgi:hypothetical protein
VFEGDKMRVFDIINESYNHFESGSYGKLSEQDFFELCRAILPGAISDQAQHFEGVYDAFVAAEKHRHTLFALEKSHTVGETMQAALMQKVKGKEHELEEAKHAEEI